MAKKIEKVNLQEPALPVPGDGPSPVVSAALASKGAICVGEVVSRPWGMFEVLSVGPTFLTKVLTIRPGCRTSYQKHQSRDEGWVVASGAAIATINGLKMELKTGAVLRVPAGTSHRLAVPEGATAPAIIMEVWTGGTLDEADIVRLEDDYGRAKA